MNYDEAVRYLLALGGELAAPRQPALGPAGARVAKFDLRNIRALAERLGAPHRAVRCAHIAGTNGKGSTAAMLESILRQAGLKTGLCTSPHLERINERIAVNGEAVPDAEFAAAFTRVQGAIEELLASGELAAHPTFFECVTAMAFVHFAGYMLPATHHPELAEAGEGSAVSATKHTGQADSSALQAAPGLGMTSKVRAVDFAVYEVGMGGRLDSTNIVQPEVCVITQIDFDHENFLGHSIEEIAGEKAGIIKPGVPVVCAAGRVEARAVIAQRAAKAGAPLIDLASDGLRQRDSGAAVAARAVSVAQRAGGRGGRAGIAQAWVRHFERSHLAGDRADALAGAAGTDGAGAGCLFRRDAQSGRGARVAGVLGRGDARAADFFGVRGGA
jgi:dihydrofolate synthase/folylpolyglutamate synthase